MLFYRPTRSGEGLLKEKGSKFLSFSYPIRTVEEIEPLLQSLKKKFFDARHHCYAYRLGLEGEIQFATDDREPAHTAGDPILAAIRARSLTDIVIFVIRYFGGTKLGVRGLIEAYRQAAEDSISTIETTLVIAKVRFTISYTYDQTSAINRILHPFETNLISQEYTDRCKQTFWIEEKVFPFIQQKLLEAGFLVDQVKSFN